MASYKILDNSINKILKDCVSLDEEEKKKYNKKLDELFDVLEEELKKQEAFKELYGKKKQYVGSYYENLKIGVPDEFDVDFELVIPSYIGQLQVCRSLQPGFCQLKLVPQTYSTGNDAVKTKVKSWFDERGFLLRSKVNQWMQGVVDNALREYRNSNEEKKFDISRSTSGPAVTLNVQVVSQPQLTFSVDLVPVFVFLERPTTVYKLHEYKKTMGDKKWYAVPKSKESDNDFRLSFWHQEKRLLKGKNQLKPVLKVMKKLRDDNNWKGIASYYLKTLFLWKDDTDFDWSGRSRGEVFMEMLKDLKEYLLVKEKLPFYWVSECDLFSQLNVAQKQNIGGFLQNMIADIDRNLNEPDYLLKYFKLKNGNRTVDNDPTLVETQHQDNTAAIAAISIGAAAVVAVGLYRMFRGNRGTED